MTSDIYVGLIITVYCAALMIATSRRRIVVSTLKGWRHEFFVNPN